jgi:predicted PurR-regulated permease PerM
MNLNLSTATRWGLNLLIILAMIGALYLGRSIFIPTIIALLFASMLWPGAAYLHDKGVPIPFFASRDGFPWLRPWVYRMKISWNVACMFLVSVLISLALLVTLGFGLAIPKMLQSLPNDKPKAQDFYERFRQRIERISPVPLDPTYFPTNAEDSQLVRYVQNALNPERSPFVVDTLKSVFDYGVSWFVQWILIMFILLFLLLEGRMLSRRVVQIFGPSPHIQSKVVEALKDMATQIRIYLVWRTIINFALALFLGMVYYLLGLSQPWTWALITAILWYVPYLGPILAGVPPVLDAFVSCESPWVAIGIIIFYILVVTVEGYLIVPVVMGRSMELNATTVMLACLFWELVWGTSGLFLAMPLMAAIKTICWHVPDWRPWANLMGTRDDDDEPPDDGKKDFSDSMIEDTQLLTEEDAAKAFAASPDDTAIGRLEREEQSARRGP